MRGSGVGLCSACTWIGTAPACGICARRFINGAAAISANNARPAPRKGKTWRRFETVLRRKPPRLLTIFKVLEIEGSMIQIEHTASQAAGEPRGDTSAA